MTGWHANRVRIALVAVAFAGCFDGCAAAHEPDRKMPMPGSDQDAHGCKASAGYAWCARTRQCERPWELARRRGFDNTFAAFARFCEVDADDRAKKLER